MGWALITGASSGLGAEFAKLFAAEGHSLILVARRKSALEEQAAAIRAQHSVKVEIVDMDLGVPGAGSVLFEKLREFDVEFLVNNAGFGNSGEFRNLPLENELKMIDLNIRTLVELTRLFLPQMLEKGRGRILNVGSTAGFQPGPYMTTYYASKAFVNSFSEALHEELKGTGVTCTVLAPGATKTEFAGAAGLDNSRLFNTPLIANSAAVAKAGYKGMMKGKALVVPGIMNRAMVQSLRVSPRFLARKLAGYVNQEAKS